VLLARRTTAGVAYVHMTSGWVWNKKMHPGAKHLGCKTSNTGTFVRRNFRPQGRKFHRVELSFSGTFVPWNVRPLELLFLGTKIPWQTYQCTYWHIRTPPWAAALTSRWALIPSEPSASGERDTGRLSAAQLGGLVWSPADSHRYRTRLVLSFWGWPMGPHCGLSLRGLLCTDLPLCDTVTTVAYKKVTFRNGASFMQTIWDKYFCIIYCNQWIVMKWNKH